MADNFNKLDVPAVPLTTKGDLVSFSTLVARLGVGSNNQVLTADSAQALGVKWATPAAGGATLEAFDADRNGSNQSVSNGAVSKVQFNSENIDTLGAYDPVTNYRFTPTVSGNWFFRAAIMFTGLTAGDLINVYIRKNGSNVVAGRAAAGSDGYAYVTVDRITAMNGTTDYVEVFADHSNAAAKNIFGSAEWSNFSGNLAH